MSQLETLYEKLSMKARLQIDEILQSGQPIETQVNNSMPSGRFTTKITDLENLRFEDYNSAQTLEDHLSFSGFGPTDQRAQKVLQKFFASDHGQEVMRQPSWEDLC